MDHTKMYYVIRTYSHTDKQQLWKVMSRPQKSREACEAWKYFCEAEYYEKNPNGKHNFFIVEILS